MPNLLSRRASVYFIYSTWGMLYEGRIVIFSTFVKAQHALLRMREPYEKRMKINEIIFIYAQKSFVV
jgi:hypothetical protein